MKKRKKVILLITFWILVVAILHSQGLITLDSNKISNVISGNPVKMKFLFLFLSSVRVLFFIPGTIFIIIGSMIFGPYEGFVLSVLSLIISQSIMYIVGRYFRNQLLGEDFLEKNKDLINIINQHGYKLLALGIACPVTPSDLITVSAACIKLDYKKCIITIILADAPMIFLYGFLGIDIEHAILFKILVVIIIIFVSYYSFIIWNNVNKNHKQSLSD